MKLKIIIGVLFVFTIWLTLYYFVQKSIYGSNLTTNYESAESEKMIDFEYNTKPIIDLMSKSHPDIHSIYLKIFFQTSVEQKVNILLQKYWEVNPEMNNYKLIFDQEDFIKNKLAISIDKQIISQHPISDLSEFSSFYIKKHKLINLEKGYPDSLKVYIHSVFKKKANTGLGKGFDEEINKQFSKYISNTPRYYSHKIIDSLTIKRR